MRQILLIVAAMLLTCCSSESDMNAIKANPDDAASYPAIDPVSVSLADYQNIIIVTPLWWSQMAASSTAPTLSPAPSPKLAARVS